VRVEQSPDAQPTAHEQRYVVVSHTPLLLHGTSPGHEDTVKPETIYLL
jgi:hypothetical protein